MEQNIGRWIPLPTFTDPRGNLTAIDLAQTAPFEVRRVFYIYGMPPGATRGDHAAFDPEFIVCLSGHCRMTIHDGKSETVVPLSSPGKGYFLPPLLWRKFDSFSEDCVLLCFSDRAYRTEDCIRNFDDFLALKSGNEPNGQKADPT